ncbi:MAG: type II toxin-antitoxin system PemK/MazF family toxin [Treponema sp.]|nr:type II toxin-antitoxin system PemK/MazF family toxin [Treponema sp.]
MMNGEIWWVDFQEPKGSAPAFVRPGIIVQNNELNDSEINTTIVIPVTTNCRLSDYKGNVFLEKNLTKLPKDSVALCSQVTTVDKEALIEKNSRLSTELLNEIYSELFWVLER